MILFHERARKGTKHISSRKSWISSVQWSSFRSEGFYKVGIELYHSVKCTYRKWTHTGGCFGLFKSLMISKAPCSDGWISSGTIHDRTCSVNCNSIDSRTMTVVGRRVSERTWNFRSDGRKGVRHPFYFAIAPGCHFIRLSRRISTIIHQIDGGEGHLGPDKSNYFQLGNSYVCTRMLSYPPPIPEAKV